MVAGLEDSATPAEEAAPKVDVGSHTCQVGCRTVARGTDEEDRHSCCTRESCRSSDRIHRRTTCVRTCTEHRQGIRLGRRGSSANAHTPKESQPRVRTRGARLRRPGLAQGHCARGTLWAWRRVYLHSSCAPVWRYTCRNGCRQHMRPHKLPKLKRFAKGMWTYHKHGEAAAGEAVAAWAVAPAGSSRRTRGCPGSAVE